MLNIGDPAPAFKAVDADGKSYSLTEFIGSFVVLFFYPGDETPGCTVEACSFRDNYSRFPAHHAVVLGISEDTAESHKAFAEHHRLPFPLLVDTDKSIVTDYDAYGKKNLFGKEFFGVKRMTYIVDPEGKIAYIWPRVKVVAHAEEVLSKLEELELDYNIA